MLRAIPSDITARLTRLNAEIARRNGYPDVSTSGPLSLPVGTPMNVGDYITPPALNTILSGLRLINSAGIPSDVTALNSYINQSDLNAVDAALTAFEAQPRGATSNSDCGSQCAGMCVTQCTTSCLSTCTGGCADGCSASCTGTCLGTCSGTCTGSCAGSCTGTCTVTCGDNCSGSCSGGCYTGCYSTCKGTCKLTCSSTCTGTGVTV